MDDRFVLFGRIINKRQFKKIIFFNLVDWTGVIQLVFLESAKMFRNASKIGNGDMVLVQGLTYITRKNEKSLRIENFLVVRKNMSNFAGFKKSKNLLYQERYKELAISPDKVQ